MSYREFELTMPTGYTEDDLRQALAKLTGLRDFSYHILLKSLDARRKDRIVWRFRCAVNSAELQVEAGSRPEAKAPLVFADSGRGRRVLVVGTGPAGIFSALYLARCGFAVQVVERGSTVEQRRKALQDFEQGAAFPTANNYAFGEGGAGTFSDGKLSSRTKGISSERDFIFETLIAAGAPTEIAYMTHPHVGSDLLFGITSRLRETLMEAGVQFSFDTVAEDLLLTGGRVSGLRTNKGDLDADFVVFATGHSAFDTLRMLMKRDVPFRHKNFALGFRAEHRQETINRAQWGRPILAGVKAAEYRLAAQHGEVPVYSFCMCPGGTVVPAGATADVSVVNGKSDYRRDGQWGNAAVVAGVNLEQLLTRPVSAPEALDWLEKLERSFKSLTGDYRVPAMTISDFLHHRSGQELPESSYPLGLMAVDMAELFPVPLTEALHAGVKEFCRKLSGYDNGIILGLESKTSAPVQAMRHPEKMYCGYENLFLAGEGSGWSGGIVSSAADGLRVAAALVRHG